MIDILTYNDLLEIGENERDRMKFILDAINEHKSSALYRTACAANDYYHLENPTIMNYQKIIRNIKGQAVPDIYSPNNKIPSNFYFFFITQAVQHLLSNGVYFGNNRTKEKLGRNFDRKIINLATEAKNGGVSFGFWNYDHIDSFSIREFVPLYDEDSGDIMAGIRFWQIDSDKPLRVTLYEIDGYTDYIKPVNGVMSVYAAKRKYKQIVKSSQIDGTHIYDGDNYDGFPIVPFYNVLKQSEIVGNRNLIDAYDLMASGLVNNTDEGNFIYWILQNCDGMNENDDEQFIERLKINRIAHANGDDGARVESHAVETPFEAHEVSLDRLEKQLYTNFMAVDVRSISAGNTTATEIRAAYEPLNSKTDLFEYCVTDFIDGILSIAGIDDVPTYKRSQVVNQAEETEMILSAAAWLDDETILRKLPWVTVDEVSEILARRDSAEIGRLRDGTGNIK